MKKAYRASFPPFDDQPKEEKVEESLQVDNVNSPPHYNNGGIECIDYIDQQLGENDIYYLEGTIMKYLHRWKYKNKPKEDLEKARWYLDRLISKL